MISIIDPIMINIYSLNITWYAFFIVSALIISLIILSYLLKNESELDFDFFLDFFIIALPLSILAARLYYVIFKSNYYFNNPEEILAIQKGGLAIHGGLIMGIAVLYFISLKKNNNFFKALDYLSPLTAFSQAVGRWGNFINQEAYGGIVDNAYYDIFPEFIKKQMYIKGYYREATFIYESAADFLLFIFLLFYLKFKKEKDGEVFSLYLIFYSVFRFFIEARRTDSLMFYGFQVAQLVSIVMIILGLILFYYLHQKN